MKIETKMSRLMGYRIICYIAHEIIAAGMCMALPGELKSLKMLVVPDGSLDELELIGILKEPHVKLAHDLALYLLSEGLNKYQVIGDYDEEVMDACIGVAEKAEVFFNRFIFYRKHPRRRDRYVNFNKVLLTSQRIMFEWCKLMLTGETRAMDMSYRCNYSPGRLKALAVDCNDYHVQIMLELIDELKACEEKSKEMLLV